MQRVLYIKFCKDGTSPIDIVYKQCFTTCFYWRKKKIAFVWFQKLVLVDCLKWEQSRCSVFIHERSSYDIRSSTNRATMTLGFRCFAQRQRRRQKRGEGERARARARAQETGCCSSRRWNLTHLQSWSCFLFALVILEMNCFLCRQENAALYS